MIYKEKEINKIKCLNPLGKLLIMTSILNTSIFYKFLTKKAKKRGKLYFDFSDFYWNTYTKIYAKFIYLLREAKLGFFWKCWRKMHINTVHWESYVNRKEFSIIIFWILQYFAGRMENFEKYIKFNLTGHTTSWDIFKNF